MEYLKRLYVYLTLSLLCINDIGAVTTISSFVVGGDPIVGPSTVTLTCTYIPGVESGQLDNLFIISFQAKLGNPSTFKNIASFNPGSSNSSPLPADGSYLENRVSLTNPAASAANVAAQAVMTFNETECEDETEYKCIVTYNGQDSGVKTVETTANIVVKVRPAVPDKVPTWIPESGIEEGTDVTFTCTGDVGKTPGKFIWTKYRGSTPTVYNDATTTSTNIPGTCTNNGTSSLTLRLTAEDNNAVIKCAVQQELATSEMYRQTQPDDLVVYYQVKNIHITKSPNLPNFAEGASAITLTCSAVGNPTPTYTWHRDTDMNTTLATGSTFTLSQSDVIVNNTGNYVCKAHNSFNGKDYELPLSELIQIDYTTTPAPTTTPSTTTTDPTATKDPQTTDPEDGGLGTGAIAGIVVGCLVAVIVIVIVIIFLKRRGSDKEGSIDEPPEKPRNNLSYVEKQDALGDKNGPFNNQIHYADLTFEDRPRSRKPLQLSQDSDLNHTPYAEVMMPRV